MNVAPRPQAAEAVTVDSETAEIVAGRIRVRMDMESPWQAIMLPEPDPQDGQPDFTFRGLVWGTLFALMIWVLIAGVFAITPDHW